MSKWCPIEGYFQGRRDKLWFLGVKGKGRGTENNSLIAQIHHSVMVAIAFTLIIQRIITIENLHIETNCFIIDYVLY